MLHSSKNFCYVVYGNIKISVKYYTHINCVGIVITYANS